MDHILDCDILYYCTNDFGGRRTMFPRSVGAGEEPVYGVPVFELCRALHLAVKYYDIHPLTFKECFVEFAELCRTNGEQTIHIYQNEFENLPGEILRTSIPRLPIRNNPPCAFDSDMYWEHFYHLVQHMRRLHFPDSVGGWWNADPPDGNVVFTARAELNRKDTVLDTNNFIPLLEQLPESGIGFDVSTLRLDNRLSQAARDRMLESLGTNGASGKLIIPVNVLIEADGVMMRRNPEGVYLPARKTLDSMKINWSTGIWNAFDFQSLTQGVFHSFIQLYAALKSEVAGQQDWNDFSDMIIISFGLYNHCRIASNEWFEGNDDIWVAVRNHFPELVLE